MKTLSQSLLAAVLACFTFAPTSSAQCPPRPDRLDGGPCCTPTFDGLPRFPNFTQDVLGICWKDCDVESTDGCFAEWRIHKQKFSDGGMRPCGVRSAALRLRDSAGSIKWRGRIYMTYSRTWQENPTSGDLQVWRFLINGDLRPTAAAGNPPCPVPPCASQNGNRVRYTGYLDYARDCNGEWQTAWMLTHACDQIDHAPGFPRAGSYHPDRSYTFVGPGASFVPGSLQPAEGGAGGFEALRRLNLPIPGMTGMTTCEYEEQAQHSLTPIQNFCLCGQQGAEPQFTAADLFVSGACGSLLQSGGLLPGFISMGLGMWIDPTRYPGLEVLRWNAGGYQYDDPCVGATTEEVWFGVTTIRGYDARQVLSTGVGPMLPGTFIDQSSSIRQNGTVMNVPYRSDHILNLNH